MEKKEVTGIWLPPRQGQQAPHHLKGAALSTDSASLNMRSLCLKRKVEIWEADWQFHLYSLGKPHSLRTVLSKKVILIPSWTLLWKASKILRDISEWCPKPLDSVNRKSHCLERIFSPFNSCMQPFYITPFYSIWGLKSSFPSHKRIGECSCHPDIL